MTFKPTDAEIKVASDFVHEWIDEQARLTPDALGHARIIRDALAELIHSQRHDAMVQGLTLTTLPNLPDPKDYLVETAFARGRRDGYIVCQNALQRLMSRKLQAGQDIEVLQEAVDCLAGVQPSGKAQGDQS